MLLTCAGQDRMSVLKSPVRKWPFKVACEATFKWIVNFIWKQRKKELHLYGNNQLGLNQKRLHRQTVETVFHELVVRLIASFCRPGTQYRYTRRIPRQFLVTLNKRERNNKNVWWYCFSSCWYVCFGYTTQCCFYFRWNSVAFSVSF